MIKSIVAVFLLVASVHAVEKCGNSHTISLKKLQYKKAVVNYVSSVSKKIAQELSKNMPIYKKSSLTVKIMPINNLYKPKKISIATKKISENLLDAMFHEGFKVVDDTKNRADAKMLGTYINYKQGMLINTRIVDTSSGIIYSSSQVFVSRKELRSINKIYDKYDWFSE